MDAQFDPHTQATQAQNLISQNVDAVFLNVIDVEGIKPSLKAFQEANIPVFVGTLPIDEEGEELTTSYIGPDHIEMAHIAAELMIEGLGDEGGKIAIIEGAPGIIIERRTSGFLEIIEKQSNIEVVDIQSSHWDRSEARAVMQDLLTKHPDLNGVFVHNDDTAMGALQAIKEANKEGEIILVGTDGNQEGYDAIEAGHMYGTIGSDLPENGRLLVQSALEVLNGNSVDSHIFIDSIKLHSETLDGYVPDF